MSIFNKAMGMGSKNTKKGSAEIKKSTTDLQMLGPQVSLEGSLIFEGTMIVNGYVKGSIESKNGTIVVGKNGVIHADISVQNASISGEIKGSVRAAERIELHPPARVFGDLNAPDVLIDAGVTVDGKCTTKPKNNNNDEPKQTAELAFEEQSKTIEKPT